MIKGSIACMVVAGVLWCTCGLLEKCMGPTVGKKLIIGSAPDGATVKLDGVTKGKTPLTLTDLDVESGQVQTLTFVLDGHETLEEKVTWTKAEQTVAVTLKAALKKRVITIKTIPDGAKVYIDGNPKGDTPASFEMELADGAVFNLLIQSKGYTDLARPITVPPETLVTVEYNMKRESTCEPDPVLDPVLSEYEKKWRNRCHTYTTDDCSFTYTIAPGGEVTDVTNVTCKFKDITGCTKATAQKMTFPPADKLRTDTYTWKGKN